MYSPTDLCNQVPLEQFPKWWDPWIKTFLSYFYHLHYSSWFLNITEISNMKSSIKIMYTHIYYLNLENVNILMFIAEILNKISQGGRLLVTYYLYSFHNFHFKNTYWATTCCCGLVASVVSDSVQPRGPQPASLLCPWDIPGKCTYSGGPCPPPGDLSDPGTQAGSPALQVDSSPLSHRGSPSNSLLYYKSRE